MYRSESNSRCFHNFEYNLIKSLDTVKKIKSYEDSIYIHTKCCGKEITKKKIYISALNYDEYILVRGNFRFRLIKGLAIFNGEIIKPSKEYINVRIPDFYPLFELRALNINNIKYENNAFKFCTYDSKNFSNDGKIDFRAGRHISPNNVVKNSKKMNLHKMVILTNHDDINVINERVDNTDEMNIDSESNEGECLYESADTVLQNYLFGLNLLQENNIKRKEFYEYLMNSDKEDIASFSSPYMMNTIKLSLYFEKYPVIIVFQKKRDFLYYFYINSYLKKLNLSNYKQNMSVYINTYQMSYVLKEFLLYIHNNKTYKMQEIVQNVEGITKKWNYRSGDLNKFVHKKMIDEANADKVDNCYGNIIEGEDGTMGKCRAYIFSSSCEKEETNSRKREFWEIFKKTMINKTIYEDEFSNDGKCPEYSDIFSITIMGDKGKGKSFLVINFINNLLNYYNSVFLLDIDIGQPIIGVSGFLSIYKIKYSLHSYNFFEKKPKCIKKIFFGGCSINENINYFIKCLEYLYNFLFSVYLKKKEENRKKKKKNNNYCCYPIVINTFGWVKDIGLFLLNLNILLSKCNFIVQIDSLKINENVKKNLSKEEFHSYVFNDFLLIKQGEKDKKSKFTILNLNNKNVSITAKGHSIFNIISEYSNLNESNFFFYDFSMSFRKNDKKEKEKGGKSKQYSALNMSGNFLRNDTTEKYLGEFKKSDDGRGKLRNSDFNGYGDNYCSYGDTYNYRNCNSYNNYGSYDRYDHYNDRNKYGSFNNYTDHSNYSIHNSYDNHGNYTKHNSAPYIYHLNDRRNFSFFSNNLNDMNSSIYRLNNNVHKIKYLNFNWDTLYYITNNRDRCNNNKGDFMENNFYRERGKASEPKNDYDVETNKNNLKNGNESEMKGIENYDIFKKKMDNFFERNCMRIINFVSYKKILSYENVNKNTNMNNSKTKIFSLLPKNLRSYRFFCHFFSKFKKIIFYIHSYSFYDGLNDFFLKHENCMNRQRMLVCNEWNNWHYSNNLYEENNMNNIEGIQFNGNKLEERYKKKEYDVLCIRDDIYKDTEESIVDLRRNKNGVTNDDIKKLTTNCNLQVRNILSTDKSEETKEEVPERSDKIYKRLCNSLLFTCAIFYLRNVKLSNIQFKNNNPEIYKNDDFFAYKYFFNNIICLCNDNTLPICDEKKGANNNDDGYSDDNNDGYRDNDKEVKYYIDHFQIDAYFESVNCIIKKEDLKKNNVELVPICEYFTHILTAYVKLIDDMKLIIYLPYWFNNFDLLNNVNTFVSGTNLIPHNINDMIKNYSFYQDIVCTNDVKTIKFLKRSKSFVDKDLNIPK
ncbi:hypothetical protein, conserved [Plasmodium malariae]|uniref:Clp1 P-loop domain-containing protein n=1 Tax=Plasmodium malariae TaxID=5858 RepID=A0A1A8VWZ9_PLAMA|nr:hypothetical protein, conserved [Plasmodium malariae]